MTHPYAHPDLALRPLVPIRPNRHVSQHQLPDTPIVVYRPTLLGLPSELRLQIYSQYFRDITIFDAPSNPSSITGLPPQRWSGSSSRWTPSQDSGTMQSITDLFLICKQIKSEAATVFYQKATLGFVGCDMLTAIAGRTKLFLNLRTVLFDSAYNNTINPMSMVSSIILDLTHTSSMMGQWAGPIPHDLTLTIFRRLIRSTPKLRSLEIFIDGGRYAIFASRHILSAQVLRYLCQLRRLTYFNIEVKRRRYHPPPSRGHDPETSDMMLTFRALNWVLNRHIRDEYLGVDTRAFDLNPRDEVFGALELQVEIVREMLEFEELKADKGLVSTIKRELQRLVVS